MENKNIPPNQTNYFGYVISEGWHICNGPYVQNHP